MPFLKNGSVSASGLEIVMGPKNMGKKDMGLLLVKYIWILLPFSGIMLLIGALNNDRYLIGRWAWAFLPLAVLAFVILKIYRDAKRIGSPTSFDDLAAQLGFGFWVALAAAVLLFFYWPKKEIRKY